MDIIAIFFLARIIGRRVSKKGHSKWRHIIHFICLWVLGNILGMSIGTLFVEGIAVFVFGLFGAIIAAILCFKIVDDLPDISSIEPEEADSESHNSL